MKPIADSGVQVVRRQGFIYLPNDESPAILLAQYRVGHLIYDQPDTVLLSGWRDPVVLARGVRFVLHQFTVKSKVDQDIGDEEDDDPAFRASRYGSFFEFEKAYLSIQIIAESETKPGFKAYGFIQHPQEILLSDSIAGSASDEEMGRKLLHLYDDWLSWKKALDDTYTPQ